MERSMLLTVIGILIVPVIVVTFISSMGLDGRAVEREICSVIYEFEWLSQMNRGTCPADGPALWNTG
jgi:hypothetical protein